MEPRLSGVDTALGEAAEPCLADPAASSGKLKSKKKMLEPKKWQSLEETGSDAPQPRRHPSLSRSDAMSNGPITRWPPLAPQVVIPVSSIAILKKANTALLVPNALSIRTAEGEKFLFVSMRTREATYQLLRSVCKHLQDRSTSSSPPASPANTISELCKKSLTSSQSDLELNPPESDGLLDQQDGLGPKQSREDEGEATAALSKGGVWPGRQTKKKPRGWWAQLSTLNVVILIYLLLVVVLLLSSGYIGLRIVALEQQLMSMGAWPEPDLHQYKTT
nr:GRAM domain-containing protein 2A-like [Chelonoidis abingdonii]